MKPLFNGHRRRKRKAFVIVFEDGFDRRDRLVSESREARRGVEDILSAEREFCPAFKLLYRINVVPK